MPSAANSTRSRRASLNDIPPAAATANTTRPASRKRIVRSRRGGQSMRASLATAKAEAQSRQKLATMTGNGRRIDDAARAATDAGRMAKTPCAPEIGLRVDIWKLNDRMKMSVNVNGDAM